MLLINIANNATNRPNDVAKYCSAPKPKPIAIHKNIYVNSSGSFIGVLNLITESAPTKPRDRAKDDFITPITIAVVILKRGKILARFFLFDKELPFFIYTLDKTVDSKKARIIDSKKVFKGIGTLLILLKM